MKIITSALMIIIFSISSVFAWNNLQVNTNIEVNNLEIVSEWEEIMNNIDIIDFLKKIWLID